MFQHSYKTKHFQTLLLSLFFVLPLYAEDVTFVARAPESVVSGQQFRVSYTVTTDDLHDFKAPSFTGFETLMGPTRSEQYSSGVQIINGKMSREKETSVTFTYILMADKEGSYTFPPASVMVKGRKLLSNSLRIKVLPPDKDASTNEGARSADTAVSGTSLGKDDIMLIASISKTKAYEQEALLLTYKLYTRESNLRLSNSKLPDFQGFHSQEIEQDTNNRWTQEHYRGRNYFVTVYRQFLLFAQKPGKQRIEAAQLELVVTKPIPVQDPFEALLNGAPTAVEIKKTLTSDPLNVEVQALPEAGKPKDFMGAVGDFTLTATTNTNKLKTNDALTTKVVISGTGNLQLIGNPKINFPSDFDVYDPKVEQKVQPTVSGMSGSKVVEYLSIPRHPGNYAVPGVSFSYFDLKTHSYKTLTTDAFQVEVEKGAGNAKDAIANFTRKEDVKILASDIRFIKQGDAGISEREAFFWGSLRYWSVYAAGLLLLVALIVVVHKRRQAAGDTLHTRRRKANKMALKRMRRAKELLGASQREAFYEEVLRTLWEYASNKLSLPAAELTKEKAAEEFEKRGVSTELTSAFKQAVATCEFARYAPATGKQEMHKIYEETLALITQIDNALKK